MLLQQNQLSPTTTTRTYATGTENNDNENVFTDPVAQKILTNAKILEVFRETISLMEKKGYIDTSDPKNMSGNISSWKLMKMIADSDFKAQAARVQQVMKEEGVELNPGDLLRLSRLYNQYIKP
ncbi:hypothetical protein AX774_g1256 [Zancudomyces culisetae]|uniref:Uncharacterized protein n=1 Tax=Zancudomyces culisetae TaxID=1213189 RepID=A0A1R1PW47_ZANCU|nr:hypothetical protein AX774_g1256 [Zancudomyces culisetae]|eukprot:OMH85195.1 hypothetical protein AX774_g1256 [Zancudomyces culisetae]